MPSLKQDWTGRLVRALPSIVLRPLGYLPRPMSNNGIVALCNRVFAAPLAAGELAFLDQRVLQITAEDAGVNLIVRGDGERLRVATGPGAPDVSIRGTAYDFLLLISQREDADTLFFQRRLRLEGDTELGLHLKNFLDAWEAPAAVRWFQQQANGWLKLAERIVAADGQSTQRPSAVPRHLR